jgi:hypothetical protein
MTEKIFKYTLEIKKIDEDNHTFLSLPRGAKVLSAATQYEQIVVYAVVNPDEKVMEDHEFIVQGTGHVIKFDKFQYEFLNTTSLYDGKLMFHIFHGITPIQDR